jgi:hypothetical protein
MSIGKCVVIGTISGVANQYLLHLSERCSGSKHQEAH